MTLINQNQSPLGVININKYQAKIIDMKPAIVSELPFRSSALKFLYRELQITNSIRV